MDSNGSKEKSISISMGAPSFRVYYGDASGAVPFTWESMPGTPKNPAFSDSNLPPLTPPPSYSYYHQGSPGKSTKQRKYQRSSLLRYVLKLGMNVYPKARPTPFTATASSLTNLSSSPSYSSFSSWSTTSSEGRHCRRVSSCGSSAFEIEDGDHIHEQLANRRSRSLNCSTRFCFPLLITGRKH